MNPLLLIVLLPLVDIVLLVSIGRHTSLGFALLLVAGGVLAGMALMRRVSRVSLRVLQNDLATGKAPLASAGTTISHFAAGTLLILPGVLSDVLAILLLVPWGRRMLGAWLITGLRGRVEVRGFSAFDESAGEAPPHDRVIDVHVVDGAREPLGGPDTSPGVDKPGRD
jgi:UPF0716 protein FxsA